MTPKKKRGRPKDPHSFHRRMVDLCTEFGSSLVEKTCVDMEDDEDESDGSDEDIWKEHELEWR
jgi:hypothetical protein